MKNLLDFFVKHSSWLVFTVYVVMSCVLLFRDNPYQQSVYLTSANGVKIFLDEIARRRMDIRKLMNLKIACIGSGTAAALEKAHLYADLVPKTFTTEALAQELVRKAGKNEKILILRAAEGNPLLTNSLENEKIQYRDCKIYRAQYSEPEVSGGEYFVRGSGSAGSSCDLCILASAGGVRSYLEKNRIPETAKAVCIGALTAAELERLTGIKPVVARQCSVEGIRQCVLNLE